MMLRQDVVEVTKTPVERTLENPSLFGGDRQRALLSKECEWHGDV
jgi:hypothetical protein